MISPIQEHFDFDLVDLYLDLPDELLSKLNAVVIRHGKTIEQIVECIIIDFVVKGRTL